MKKERRFNPIFVFVVFVAAIIFITCYKCILMFLLFNGFYYPPSPYSFVNKIFRINDFYKMKYKDFFEKYKTCSSSNFQELPYLTKEELIEYNDLIITPPFKKCKLTCANGCVKDPLWFDSKCSIGQSTGGTSGKSTFVWMNKYDAYIYIYTFMTSFRKNGYTCGDKLMVFYPANSYFTNEYEKSNYYLMFMNVYFLSFSKVDEQKTIEFVNSINEKKPDFVVIFPFVLLQLCINIKLLNLSLTHFPKNINLSGEFLLNCSLNFCKSVFTGSNIENTYGAVEFGEIAHQVKGDKNTFEVFNQFCYLENKGEQIVVTSLINSTFPIIRYVMEDIGQIINKDGKQYITNLIGKNTNQIIINDNKFTSLDVDNMIDTVNISNNIISIVIEYDNFSIDVNYIVYDTYTQEQETAITQKTYRYMEKYFNRVKYTVRFVKKYVHDYLKKFKIIVKKDNSDSEPVGGFFRY
jgi:phenylacetate-coenzyme A ligase PaaK-like adenylate-forming protein